MTNPTMLLLPAARLAAIVAIFGWALGASSVAAATAPSDGIEHANRAAVEKVLAHLPSKAASA